MRFNRLFKRPESADPFAVFAQTYGIKTPQDPPAESRARQTPTRRSGSDALCVEEEDGSTEIAFFELRREALPGALGISLYTSPDGELQRKHLQGNDHVVIVAKSPRDLLEAMNTGVPSSVFLNGERIAGSVFKAMLEEDLGFSLRQPRIVRLDEPDLS
jgi:hypothetical protein